jgi:predicted O-linked N-acetylglucosamine transferase (SPINDLY family)
VAASVLHAAGLGELAFAQPAECVHAVATLAAHPELLAAYRNLLVQQRLQMPLFDTALQAAGMAELLARMAARWRAGLPPAPLLACCHSTKPEPSPRTPCPEGPPT